MAYCPNCSVSLQPSELEHGCGNCGAQFQGADWKPTDTPTILPVPQRRVTQRRVTAHRVKPFDQPRSTERSVMGSMLLRTFVAVPLVVLVFFAALLSAIPYGGGSREFNFFAVLMTIFMLGWVSLPIFRASRIVAAILTALWCALGVYLSRWPSFEPWLLATIALVVCLLRSPPIFWRSIQQERRLPNDG